MNDRKKFITGVSKQFNLNKIEQAVALLWYYEQTQQYNERSVSDLSKDIEEDGFGTQNTSRLKQQLISSKFTVKGTRKNSFRINATYFDDITSKYGHFLDIKELPITSSVIPFEFVSGTRTYLERLVKQINGSYDSGFFDASLVILRRLMESLIIEIYQKESRVNEIKDSNNNFFQLSKLLLTIINDNKILKSRGFNKGVNLIKDLGDTSAHDRTYITPREDIDDNKLQIRKTIYELLILSGIKN